MRKIQSNKNIFYYSLAVSAAIFLSIGIIFHKEIKAFVVQDRIQEADMVKQAPPPPPPPPPPPTVMMEKPEKMEVHFSVSAPSIGAQTNAFDKSMFLTQVEGGQNWDDLAMSSALDQEGPKVEVKITTNVVFDKIGLSGIEKTTKDRTKFEGKGRRATGVIAVTYLKTDDNWDQHWMKGSQPFEAINSYFKEETQFKLNTQSKFVDLSDNADFEGWTKVAKEKLYTFEDDFKNQVQKAQGKKVSAEMENVALEPELVALERLKALSSAIAHTDNSLGMEHIDLLEIILRDYHQKKYELKTVNLASPAKLLDDIAKDLRQELRPWRQDYIKKLSAYMAANKGRQLSQTDLKLPWMYFRKSEILLSPVLFAQPNGGMEVKKADNMEILVNYLKNGGCLYLTDPTEDQGAIQKNRAILRDLVSQVENKRGLDAIEKKTLASLSKLDRNVPGWRLFETTRDFPHPQVPVEFEVPAREVVTITVYNRLGQKIKTILNKNLAIGKYNYNNKTAITWNSTDEDGSDVASGTVFIQMQAGIFQKTQARDIPPLRLIKEKRHPIFSVYYNLGGVPVARVTSEAQYREFGQRAYEYSYNGLLAVFYSEGFGELHGFGLSTSSSSQESILWGKAAGRWMANFFAYVLGQGGNTLINWPG